MEQRDTNVVTDIESELEDQIGTTAESGPAQVRNTLEEFKSVGRQKLDQVEQYIEDEPLKSVLIATGIGVLLGALIKR